MLDSNFFVVCTSTLLIFVSCCNVHNFKIQFLILTLYFCFLNRILEGQY